MRLVIKSYAKTLIILDSESNDIVFSKEYI
jgi:hypothetical protein